MSSFCLTNQLTVFPFLISGIIWKYGNAGHRFPYLSHAKRALYHLSYIPVEETGSYCLIKPFLCYWNSWTESSIAHRSNFGFVDAGHQSMCFSHANRLPSRLTCFAGGVQRRCLCQWDVFDSLISIVIFPSTSFWGKPWWFGTPIAFLAGSVLFQMLPFQLDVQFHCFFWSNKTASRISFFDFRAPLKNWRWGGIDPRTSCLQNERSTIWATSLVSKRAADDIWSLSFVNTMVEQSFLLNIVVKLALSMRVINPCVSHMPIACPPDWHASLVGSNGAGYVRRMSSIHSSV